MRVSGNNGFRSRLVSRVLRIYLFELLTHTVIAQEHAPAKPYKNKPFPMWDEMLEINGSAAATGEDAVYPGASILHSGNSFRDLDSQRSHGAPAQHVDNHDKQSDVQEDTGDEDNAKGAGSREEDRSDDDTGDHVGDVVSSEAPFQVRLHI